MSFLNPGIPDQRVLGLLDTGTLQFRPIRLADQLPLRSGITGLASCRQYIFAVLQVSRGNNGKGRFAPPALITFDRVDFGILSQYTFPSALDVHSLSLDGETLYAVSTGTDEVLALQLDGPNVVGESVFWRPDAGAPREDLHHLNAVCCQEGRVLVSGFGRKSGALWSSARDGFIADVTQGVIVRHGIQQPHSLTFIHKVVAYCESAERAIQIGEDIRVTNLPGYTRGLCAADGKLFVGTSNRRRVSKSTGIAIAPSHQNSGAVCAISRLSLTSGQSEATIDLGNYAEEIYDLLPVQSTALWPVDAAMIAPPNRAWQDQVCRAYASILDIVPAGATFVLVDEDRWGAGPCVQERRSIPFLQRDGIYWGPPKDDETAIQELEIRRVQGARFIIIGWPAFWWLDAYPHFHRHLRSRFSCIIENDHFIAFDLTL